MDYQRVIGKALTRTFKLLVSLETPVVLEKKAPAEFDFSTASVAPTATSATTTGIQVDRVKKNDTETITVLLKVSEVGDLNAYDKATMNGFAWTLGPQINADDNIVVIELYRRL